MLKTDKHDIRLFGDHCRSSSGIKTFYNQLPNHPFLFLTRGQKKWAGHSTSLWKVTLYPRYVTPGSLRLLSSVSSTSPPMRPTSMPKWGWEIGSWRRCHKLHGEWIREQQSTMLTDDPSLITPLQSGLHYWVKQCLKYCHEMCKDDKCRPSSRGVPSTVIEETQRASDETITRGLLITLPYQPLYSPGRPNSSLY